MKVVSRQRGNSQRQQADLFDLLPCVMFKTVTDFVVHVHKLGCVEPLKLEKLRFISFTTAYYEFHVTRSLIFRSWTLEGLPVLSCRTLTISLTLLTAGV